MAEPQVTLRIKVDARDGTATVEGFANKVDDAAKRSGRSFSDVAAAAGKVGAAVAAAAAAAAGAAVRITATVAENAQQITRLAAVSNTGTTEFQRYAAAAQMFGVEQEKLADIFKDVQDKVGDFLQTGGGPLADFFDNIAPRVGVTAEQFRNLSGPDALQLYISSLEQAGVAQSEMVFFLESIASDATQLAPVFRENGAAAKEFGDQAERLGVVIGEDGISALQQYQQAQRQLGQAFDGIQNQIAVQLAPGLAALAEVFLDTGSGAAQSASSAMEFANGIRWVIQQVLSAIGAFEKFLSVTTAVGQSLGSFAVGLTDNFKALGQFQKDILDIGPIDAYTKFAKTAFTNMGAVVDDANQAFSGLQDTFAAIDGKTEERIKALNTTLDQTSKTATQLAGGGAAGGGGRSGGVIGAVADGIADIGDEANYAKSEVDPFRTSIDRLLDRIEDAQVDRLAADMVQLQIALDDAIAEGDIERAERLAAALEQLSVQGVEGFGDFRDAGREAFDTLADEGRALEDALSSAVGDFVSGNIDSFGDFADAVTGIFRNLIADLIRQWVQANIFQQGADGAGGIFSNLFGSGSSAGNIAQAIGSPFGTSTLGRFGNGAVGAFGLYQGLQTGGVGGALQGGLGGFQLGNAIVPGIGGIVGAVLGAIGGFFGGDDPKPRIRINSSGAGIGNIGTRGTTSLGSLAFNADDLEDTRGTERELLQAIQALDDGFVQLVTTFGLGEEQLAALRDAAAGWSVDLRNSAITAENVLGSRFTALLGTFDETIQQFVRGAGDLDAQFQALSEALFIRAAAEAGQVGDTFEQVQGVLERFRVEGEHLDATYARVVASTLLLEDALGFAGVSIDIGREAFIDLANEIVEAAGGLQQAQSLWADFFNTFYSDQERAAATLEQATRAAALELEQIGLSLGDFTGSEGLAQFRALFESVLPELTAEQVVAWLEAARALGILTDATAQFAQYVEDVGNRLGAGTRPGGGAVFDPGAEIIPGGGVREAPRNTWQDWLDEIRRGMTGDDGVVVRGGNPIGRDLPDAIDRTVDALNRWIDSLDRLQRDLLTDETLTVLTPAERLAEIERQYQEAFAGAVGGDETARSLYDGLARQLAEAGRDFYGSNSQYSELFAGILADIGTLRSTAVAEGPAVTAQATITNSPEQEAREDARINALIREQEQIRRVLQNIEAAVREGNTVVVGGAERTVP